MRQRLFNFIAWATTRHPRKIIIAAVVLAVLSGIYAATHIRLNANLDDLVSEKLDYHRRYIDFLKEFGDEEYLYVVVDASHDTPAAKRFLEVLGARLKNNQDLTQVIWKIENPALERNFLLYLTPDQLGVLEAMLTRGPFSVKNIASWDGFAPMFGALATRIGEPVSEKDEAELTTGFTFIDGLIDDMTGALENGTPYRSRLQTLFFGDDTFDPDGFLKNGDLLFMLIMPVKDYSTAAVIEKPLREIRQAIADTKRDFPGLDAGLTGRPVLSADEMETSNRDMTLATIVAIVLVSIIFILSFRSVGRPLCAVATLIIGISWTFGFVALSVGTLNILSSVFALLLIGASIEYSIYLVARYQEELAKSGDVTASISKMLSTTGMAVVTSALAVAVAFCTLIWTDFLALAQLGIISAMGIFFCLSSMLIVLPAMIAIRDRRYTAERLMKVKPLALPQLSRIYRRPVVLVSAAALFTAAMALLATKLCFDNNLLNLQARGLDSVRYEHLIIEKSSETTWFARATADTMEESHKKAEAFRKLASVRRVDDVERILPEGQEAKIKAVREMAPDFAGLSFAPVGDAVDSKMLMFDLGRLASNLERLEDSAFKSGRVDAVDELGKFASKIRGLVSLIDSADGTKLKNLGAMQRDFFADLQKSISILASGMDPTTITLEDLPSDVRVRFVSPKGRYALMIYPKEDIWDPQALKKFVEDIRGVDPQAIGTPIEVHESGRLMRDTFARSAALSFIVICLLVFFDFRSVRPAALAVMPLVLGLIWLFGAMGLAGIQLNMANFFGIPILIGTGVNFGVQVIHRLRQDKKLDAMGSSTGMGLIMAALTNGAGFGTMMIAHHRGIASLGEILVVGCFSCLAAAIAVAPPVAKWLDRW